MAIGKGVSIEYVKESSYGGGAPANPTMLWLGNLDSQPRIKIDPGLIKKKNFGNVEYAYIQSSKKELGFDADFVPQDAEMVKAAILKTGAATTRAVNETLDSYFFDIGINGVYWACSGVKINTLGIGARVGEEVKFGMNAICKDISVGTSAVSVGSGSHASASATLPVIFSGALIQRGGTPADLFASEFSFDINNSLRGIQKFNVSGTKTIDSLLEGDLVTDGSVNVWLENKTIWDEIVAGTASQILIKLKYGSTTLTATLANAQFERGEVISGDNEGAMYQLPFTHKGITIEEV